MTLARTSKGTVADPRGDQDSLQKLIDKYGDPCDWDEYTWFVNQWRQIVGAIGIRFLLDMALRGDDAEIRKQAMRRFGKVPFEFDIDALDREWPCRGAFDYDLL